MAEKIVYITSNCPHGPTYGSQIRALNVARGLQACGEVSMVLLERGSSFDGVALQKTRGEFRVEMVMTLESRGIRGWRERMRHEFDPRFPNTHGYRANARDAAVLKQLVQNANLVWAHNVFSVNHAGLHVWPNTILDVDDVLSQYYRTAMRAAESVKNWLQALRHHILWLRRERLLLRRFSSLVVCSEADKRYLGGSPRIGVVPNGYGECAVEPKRVPARPCRVGFIGTLDYGPNLDGIRWFIRYVWPGIVKAHPGTRLRLVGQGTDREAARSGPEIDGLGRLENAADEIATWTLGVVPLRIGGGTRVKIAEGFSRRCPQVSTTLGAFGYDIQSGREILLADTPEEFGNACSVILRDPGYGSELAERAWEAYRDKWTWSAIRPSIEKLAAEYMRGSP